MLAHPRMTTEMISQVSSRPAGGKPVDPSQPGSGGGSIGKRRAEAPAKFLVDENASFLELSGGIFLFYNFFEDL